MPSSPSLFSLSAKEIEASVLKLADEISRESREEDALKKLNELEKYGALGYFLKGSALLKTNSREAYKCFKIAELLLNDRTSKQIVRKQISLIKSNAIPIQNLLKVNDEVNQVNLGNLIKNALVLFKEDPFNNELITQNLDEARRALAKTLAKEELERHDIDMPHRLPKEYQAEKHRQARTEALLLDGEAQKVVEQFKSIALR